MKNNVEYIMENSVKKNSVKKKIKIVSASIAILLVTLLIIATISYRRELATLNTLKKVDNYPFYTMCYKGDYGFDEFLKQGAKNDSELINFITKRLLKGININLNIDVPACTTFYAKNTEGENIVGRNFDFTYAPSALVKTTPDNGYASISMVNLSYLGYNKNKLPVPKEPSSILTLAAPYIPMDGINECGVVISIMAIPERMPAKNTDKITLNTTTAVRLVLDKAATVDEAVKLLEKYDLYFSGGLSCHYLIGDATGKSVIVEWVDGDMKVTPADKNYQVSTNYIIYNNLKIGRGFERFKIATDKLESCGGILSEPDAMDLLQKADTDANPAKEDVSEEKTSITQWSVVYNTATKEADIAINKDFKHIYTYKLNDFN